MFEGGARRFSVVAAIEGQVAIDRFPESVSHRQLGGNRQSFGPPEQRLALGETALVENAARLQREHAVIRLDVLLARGEARVAIRALQLLASDLFGEGCASPEDLGDQQPKTEKQLEPEVSGLSSDPESFASVTP